MWPWQNSEFGTGLAAAAVVLALLLPLSGLARLKRPQMQLPLGGIAFTAAGVWSINSAYSLPISLLVGLAGLAVAAALADLPGINGWFALIPAAPFAWLVAFYGQLPGDTWIRLAVFAVALFGGALAAATDHEWRAGSPTLALLAVSVAGVYATAPDTEETLPLLAISAVLATVGWPLRLARLGRAGAAASIGLLVWAAAYDGRGRPSSIVGGLACIGLLATLPLCAWVHKRRPDRRQSIGPIASLFAILAFHLAIVLVQSRVAGLRDDVPTALTIALPTFLVALAGTVWLADRVAPGRV